MHPKPRRLGETKKSTSRPWSGGGLVHDQNEGGGTGCRDVGKKAAVRGGEENKTRRQDVTTYHREKKGKLQILGGRLDLVVWGQRGEDVLQTLGPISVKGGILYGKKLRTDQSKRADGRQARGKPFYERTPPTSRLKGVAWGTEELQTAITRKTTLFLFLKTKRKRRKRHRGGSRFEN